MQSLQKDEVLHKDFKPWPRHGELLGTRGRGACAYVVHTLNGICPGLACGIKALGEHRMHQSTVSSDLL